MDVCIVCARKVTGPSPLRGTIVDNVDPGRSEQAFASRVSTLQKFEDWDIKKMSRLLLVLLRDLVKEKGNLATSMY